jgi:hypothetical protein
MFTSSGTSGASRPARRGRLGVVLALGVACVVALVVAGRHTAQAMLLGRGSSSQPAAFVARQTGGALASRTSPGSFRIGGTVDGLYPGDSTELVLTVTNPQHFAIVVTTISTTVESPSAGCGAPNLTVAGFTGHLLVGAHGSAQLTVPVALSYAAPDACQGALFPLQYSGLARKA